MMKQLSRWCWRGMWPGSMAMSMLLSAATFAHQAPSPTAVPESASRAAVSKPAWPAEQLKRGRQLYLQNCMVCHGFNGEGAPDWSRQDAEGKWPAPPLNGTGHTWHHPKQALVYTIKNGTQRIGGNMPAWQDKLSDQDIVAIIAWFQSQWPDEIYAAWQRMDEEAQQTKR